MMDWNRFLKITVAAAFCAQAGWSLDFDQGVDVPRVLENAREQAGQARDIQASPSKASSDRGIVSSQKSDTDTAADPDAGYRDGMWPPGTEMWTDPPICNWAGHTGYYAICLTFENQPTGHTHTVPAPPPIQFKDASVPYPGFGGALQHCYLKVPLNQGGVKFRWVAPAYATILKRSVFFMPSPGGPYYCENGGSTVDLVFGVSGMQQLQPGLGYQLEPGSNSHPDVHYGQMITVNGIQAIAAQYMREFPMDLPLPIMRMSLPKGGLFDIDDNWAPPLVQHRLGWEVDVKSVYIPQEHRSRLEEIVKAKGAQIIVCPGEYYHLDFTPQTPTQEAGPMCD